MKLFRAVVAIAALVLYASQAFAWGCPPWQMCGKRHNLILGDHDNYTAQVSAAVQGAGSVVPVTVGVAPGPMDIQMELQRLELELASAEARAAELQRLQQSRRSGSSFWVFDRSAPSVE